MEELNYIENTALPIEVNFEELKDKALAYIQRNNKGTWTNLNPSDPGVTILDQLCYALTELGYCNNFPIKDILTDREGNLAVKNQFYVPEDILTTTPITIDDFRKYLVDTTENVVNAQIMPVTTNSTNSGVVYEVFLLIDDLESITAICESIKTIDNIATLIYKNVASIYEEATLISEKSKEIITLATRISTLAKDTYKDAVFICDLTKAICKEAVAINEIATSIHKNKVFAIEKVKEIRENAKAIVEYVKLINTKAKAVCEHAFFQLNTCRNLGELFLYPELLIPEKWFIYGEFEIEIGFDLNTILVAIEKAVNNYVYPKLIQKGYEEIKKEGTRTNEIFNGPKLKNGWISEGNMYAKRNRIQVYEVTEIIKSIPGVVSVTNVFFTKNELKEGEVTGEKNIQYEVQTTKEKIVLFDLPEIKNTCDGKFKITRKGKSLKKGVKEATLKELASMEQPYGQICKVSTIKLAPALPEGNYRDISSYFSIQNTFPSAYAVGVGGMSANASDFQIAQSRQLKGYLTLFDQVLTNQFMQLANVGSLFSFENSVTGDPTDTEQFYSVKTAFEKKHLQYPAPYVCFSPTYYYQSLYNEVPHIRPLLRNFEKHDANYGLTAIGKQNNGWNEYQQDPYNTYIWGLLSFMEDEDVNLERRNTILDHLLARHGESPSVLDTIIEGTVYSGNSIKDKVIIKSLYLQNLGLLSYYRTKAYNFIGASPLKLICTDSCKEKTFSIHEDKEDTVTDINSIREEIKEEIKHNIRKCIKEKRHEWLQGNQKDFIFDTEKVNEEQRITKSDFINFSAVELKLNLLFVLNVYYRDYLIDHVDFCAYWLITQRKGFLCIEMNLLKESAIFEINLRENNTENMLWKSTQKLSYAAVLSIENALKEQTSFSKIKEKHNFSLASFKNEEHNFETIENTSFLSSIKASWGETTICLTDDIFDNALVFIFPDFFDDEIAEGAKRVNNQRKFKISNFKNRLHYFFESELPVQITPITYYVKKTKLKALIIAYCNWYNSLRFKQHTEESHGLELSQHTEILLNEIIMLNQKKYD